MFRRSEEPQSIRIGLYGDPASGRKSLSEALNGRIFYRSCDKRSFKFDVQIQPNTPPFMSVITVDATQYRRNLDMEPALQAAESTSPSALCVVLTKLDLIPPGVCTARISLMGAKSHHAYLYGRDYLSISSVSGEGMEELQTYIVNTFSPPQPSSSIFGSLSSFRNTFISMLIDTVVACFALPVAHTTKNVDSELAAMPSDDAIDQLCKSAIASTWGTQLAQILKAPSPSDVPAHRVSDSLIVKWPTSSERASMILAQHSTSIPIPRVHHPHLKHLVMDFIDGEPLIESWHKMTWFMQFRVACTLRRYVRQLQSLKSSRIGGVDNGRIHGVLFGENSHGPFASPIRFRQFCEVFVYDSWRSYVELHCSPGDPLPRLPQMRSCWDPVFVHGDLNMSNIILDRSNTLWIIDWATAAYCPASLESQSMRYFNDVMWPNNYHVSPHTWRRYRQFIAGPTDKEEDEFWDFLACNISRAGGSHIL
ncbi:hypothetical protein EVG20_g10059 [Dentipellis fragilis]|uniref:Aminoglycoside phosphotransferase domain-containing protein n=1 Tax=Dentipellis fragilis TaxID=205917 RepID=A0A4Y9XWR2_9AGAM|nr:hypothetical protein EVG20_g10059 [Dentipellis fragilis]